jgi:hypothetical protein
MYQLGALPAGELTKNIWPGGLTKADILILENAKSTTDCSRSTRDN